MIVRRTSPLSEHKLHVVDVEIVVVLRRDRAGVDELSGAVGYELRVRSLRTGRLGAKLAPASRHGLPTSSPHYDTATITSSQPSPYCSSIQETNARRRTVRRGPRPPSKDSRLAQAHLHPQPSFMLERSHTHFRSAGLCRHKSMTAIVEGCAGCTLFVLLNATWATGRKKGDAQLTHYNAA